MLLSPMLAPEPLSLVGTTALADLRVDSLVSSDAALATYAATSTLDGAPCTLRVALGLELPEERDEAVGAALARLIRHTLGIRGLCQPRAAGAVTLGSRRLLAVAHLGSALESAEHRIQSGSPMAMADVAAALQPVAAALAALHDQGLVHGAVHPGAVQLGGGPAVLSGFGWSELASVLGGSAAARDVVPPRSRVPEQVGIVPASPSPESDTYAVAMIACELLAGRPFTAESEPSAIARAIDNPLVRPTPAALSVTVPELVEKAFAAALQSQPRERARSARELLAALASPDAPASTHEPLGPAPVAAPPASRRLPAPAEPTRSQRSAFAPSEAGPAAPKPLEAPAGNAAAWLVYALVALGLVLLVGGAATVFVLAQRRVASPVSPVVSAPSLGPLPSPAPTEPQEPEADNSVQPVPPAPPGSMAKPLPSATGSIAQPAPAQRPTPAAAAPSYYPEDLTALVPLSRETPILGSRDALVTIVAFADMQCPHTRQARGVLESVRKRYEPDLRIAVRHLPIPSHDKAEDAAEIAATVGVLSGPLAFWSVFEKLTTNQGGMNLQDMLQSAEQAGAPMVGVRRSLEEHVYKRIVDADRLLAHRLMVRATPTFFVNGKRADGELPQAALADMIDKELIASRSALAKGLPRARLYSSRVTFNVTAGEADPPRVSPPRRH